VLDFEIRVREVWFVWFAAAVVEWGVDLTSEVLQEETKGVSWQKAACCFYC
jgi:hypothetical protein